ncbi:MULTISPECIES: peptide deformylase [Psychrobacter]|uniref:peptide deformylase n=1 Tax=Psychrobacter TaxID=497 RepID=UPI0019183B0B|nr:MULTISPECIES: peptide deformylase [Psychrobacter]
MALLPILNYPDPRLRTIATPVKEITDDIKTLITDMIETMYDAQGIGLAASQVDQHIQLIVMDLSEDKDTPMVFINPKVTPLVEEKQPYEEGCLSVPDVYDKVERPNKVHIEALDENGKAMDKEVEGLLAVCIQHEMDHLNGVIFVDYLSHLKQTRARDKVRKVLKIREKQEQDDKQIDKQPQATNI